MNRTWVWLSAMIVTVLMISCTNRDIDLDTSVSVPVSVEDIQKQSIEEFIETTGTVRAAKSVELQAETDGYYRLAKGGNGKTLQLGDRLGQDQVIVHLDNPELVNNTAIESKELELDISKSEFEKQQALYEKGGVTLRELKDAEQAFINAQYSYENAKLQLAKTEVRAPFDGVLVDLPYYTPGVKVPTGSDIATVMDYSELHLDVNFPGKYLPRVSAGQPVRAFNYTLEGDTLRGEITQVSPAINEETRTFKASMRFDNPDLSFRPGMFVKTETIVARKDSAIVIPKDIIVQFGGSKRVFIVERGAAVDRRIETGLENPAEVEVVRGLDVGERLVVKGYETLSDRTKVNVIR